MNSLTTSLAWPVAAVVVAIVGGVTYLASNGNLAASDVTTIFVLILGALGITATAHVTGTVVNNAANPPPPPNPPTKVV